MRGSGTSGYVQGSKFNLRGPPRTQHGDGLGDAKPPPKRTPNLDILEHNRKREIELQVEMLRDELEGEGFSEEDIEQRLVKYRAEVQDKAEGDPVGKQQKLDGDTHAIAQRKEQHMERIRNAFGFKDDIREGEAFDRELQQEKRQQRIAEREAREEEKKALERKLRKAQARREREEKDRKWREEEDRRREAKKRRRESHYDAKYRPPERYDEMATDEKNTKTSEPLAKSGRDDAPAVRERDIRDGKKDESPSPPRHRRGRHLSRGSSSTSSSSRSGSDTTDASSDSRHYRRRE